MTGKILYIDACAGLSGDMLAGALMDLGWPLDDLKQKTRDMGLAVKLDALRMDHQGISALRLSVDDDADQKVNQNPSHLHEQHHKHQHEHNHEHQHEHRHKQNHEHHHGHGHHHRHLSHILKMLGKLPPATSELACQVFKHLAQAEAKVHGKDPESVHFHEVGAVDAIVDVTAFCAGLAWLGVDKVICSPLPLGRGFFTCAHGRMPLPPPAVLNLLGNAPVTDWPEAVETVTPTGAALVSSAAHEFGPMPNMRLIRTGIGGGSRTSGYAPNIVRLLLGEPRTGSELDRDQVVELACNVDDMLPEDLPLVYERLFEQGALDVSAAHLLMKKGRPGLELKVMVQSADAERLAEVVLHETSSLGVRIKPAGRMILPRTTRQVDTPWGPVRVKLAQSRQTQKSHAEADDIMRICREHGLRPTDVRQKVLELLNKD